MKDRKARSLKSSKTARLGVEVFQGLQGSMRMTCKKKGLGTMRYANLSQSLAEQNPSNHPKLLYSVYVLQRLGGKYLSGMYASEEEAIAEAKQLIDRQERKGGYAPHFKGVEVRQVQQDGSSTVVFDWMFRDHYGPVKDAS